MLGVGTRVRLRLDRGCRRQHARHASGQVGRIVAIVTDDVLAPTGADLGDQGACLSIEAFAGHLYTVELNEPNGLNLDLYAASELEPLPR
jgi:hypothetical protein